jgi:hypothetical protein
LLLRRAQQFLEMPSNKSKQKIDPCHFPGDPRFGIPLSLIQEDLLSLRENKMLSTRLLDFLIQQGAPPPSHTTDNIYVGSLSTHFYIRQANALLLEAHGKKQHVKKIAKIRSTLQGFKTAAAGSKLVIPLIFDQHFFVVVIELSGTRGPEFYNSVKCYDSLRHSVRISKLHPGRSSISDFLADFHQFVLNFILSGQKHQQVTATAAVSSTNVHFHPCPSQSNGIDCGLFAVAIVLHIIDGVSVDDTIFDQGCITQLRTELTSHLSGVKCLKKNPLPSSVVRKCFSRLKRFFDVENEDVSTVVIPPAAAEQQEGSLSPASNTNDSQSTSVSSRNTDASKAGEPHKDFGSLSSIRNSLARIRTIHDKENNTIKIISSPTKMATRQTNRMRPGYVSPQQQITTTTSIGSATFVDDVEEGWSTNDAELEDTAFEAIMKEFKMESFATLDEVEPLIDTYQSKTGNRLAIRRSERDKYRVYQCVEHVECCFKIQVGRRRSDGLYCVKKAYTDTTVFVAHPGQLTDDVGNNVVLEKLKGIFCTLQM